MNSDLQHSNQPSTQHNLGTGPQTLPHSTFLCLMRHSWLMVVLLLWTWDCQECPRSRWAPLMFLIALFIDAIWPWPQSSNTHAAPWIHQQQHAILQNWIRARIRTYRAKPFRNQNLNFKFNSWDLTQDLKISSNTSHTTKTNSIFIQSQGKKTFEGLQLGILVPSSTLFSNFQLIDFDFLR